MITGPITEKENNDKKIWGSWVYKGGILTAELKCPLKQKNNIKLHISNIAYGYKDIYGSEVANFGESAACNINVLCALGNGFENQRNSVALILDSNGAAMCSGALINNTCNLNIPFLLTANHCFAFDPDVANWRFTFQAWSATCTPTQNAAGINALFNGSTLRANNAGSDFCLVELNQVPTGNLGLTYSGWSRNTTGIQQTTIIHHPAGDVMKISRDNDPPIFGSWPGSPNPFHWLLVIDQGATQGGSSGAPYFDQNLRIIGQHHGINQTNSDPCLNTNKFGGRFDISWTGGGTNATRLSNWLDPGNSGAMTTNTGPLINGPNLICTNGTFTLQNQLLGSTIIWSSNNSNILSINAGNGVATRQGNANGNVTIIASLQSPGSCNTSNFTRTVFVGSPLADNSTLIYPSNQRGVDPVTLLPSTVYQFNSDFVAGATSYTWVLPSGFSFVNGKTTSTPGIRTSANYGSYTINCSPFNTCGSSWTHSLTVIIDGSCTICPRIASDDGDKPDTDSTFDSIALYPNPANTELKVRLRSLSEQDGELSLIDISGNIKRNRIIQKGTQWITRDIDDISSGMYYLKITDGFNEYYQKVLIQH